MPADDINDDDSISRGANQESHPSEGFPQSFYCKFQRIAPERKFLWETGDEKRNVSTKNSI